MLGIGILWWFFPWAVPLLNLPRARTDASRDSAIVIAASIFLDIFNVFLLPLELFGGSRE